MASAWPSVAADLRRALLQRGRPAADVDRLLGDLAPVFAAVERARGKLEDDLVWALVGLAADKARRAAQVARSQAGRR